MGSAGILVVWAPLVDHAGNSIRVSGELTLGSRFAPRIRCSEGFVGLLPPSAAWGSSGLGPHRGGRDLRSVGLLHVGLASCDGRGVTADDVRRRRPLRGRVTPHAQSADAGRGRRSAVLCCTRLGFNLAPSVGRMDGWPPDPGAAAHGATRLNPGLRCRPADAVGRLGRPPDLVIAVRSRTCEIAVSARKHAFTVPAGGFRRVAPWTRGQSHSKNSVTATRRNSRHTCGKGRSPTILTLDHIWSWQILYQEKMEYYMLLIFI